MDEQTVGVPASSPEKKKSRKWPYVLLIIFVLLVLGAGMTGFVPVVSDILGTNAPRDLGVKVTQADYDSALAATGFKLDSSAGYGPDTHITYSGQKAVSVGLTDAQLSALIDFDHATQYPVRNAQVKIHADGTLEAAAYIKVDSYKGYSVNNAVYVKGSFDVLPGGQIKLHPAEVQVGRAPVPLVESGVAAAEQEVNSKIASIPGLSIQSITYEEGKVNFKGTIPASAKRVKL